jgi:hypothetical protein
MATSEASRQETSVSEVSKYYYTNNSKMMSRDF